MSPRIRIVCSHCGSDDVSKDATVRWCVETQEWEVTTVHDQPNFCDHCDGETSLRDEPEITTWAVRLADTITIRRAGVILVRAKSEEEAIEKGRDATHELFALDLLDEEQIETTPWEVTADTDPQIQQFGTLLEDEKSRPAGLDGDEIEKKALLRRTHPVIQDLDERALWNFQEQFKLPGT